MKDRQFIVKLFLLAYIFVTVMVYLYECYQMGMPVKSEAFCVSDLLILSLNPLNYLVSMLFPLLLPMIKMLETRNSYLYVLRAGKKSIQNRQLRACLIWSISCSVCFILAVLILGAFVGKCWINWDQADSYLTMTEKIVLPNVKFFHVVVLSCTVQIFRNLFCGLILMLSCWGGRRVYLGLLAVVSGCIIEFGCPGVTLLLRGIYAGYACYESAPAACFRVVIVLLCLAGMCALLTKLVKRKEYL